MEDFFTNPGFALMTDKIVSHLDSKTLVRCRLVNTSFKNFVDNPNLWLQRCKKKSINEICLAKWKKVSDYLLDSDKETIEEINVDKMVEYLSISLMKICTSYHKVQSPIHYASMEGNLDLLKLVLKVTEKKEYRYRQDLDYIEALGRHNVSPLDLAANYGHLEVVKYLKNYTKYADAAFRIYFETGGELWRLPIYFAIKNGQVEVVKYFIVENKGGHFPGYIDNRMLMNSAIQNGQLEVLKFIVDYFGPPNQMPHLLPCLPGMIEKALALAYDSSGERKALFHEIANYLKSL